jgi:hypothetical protein
MLLSGSFGTWMEDTLGDLLSAYWLVVMFTIKQWLSSKSFGFKVYSWRIPAICFPESG